MSKHILPISEDESISTLNYEVLMAKSEEKERQLKAEKRAVPGYQLRKDVNKAIKALDGNNVGNVYVEEGASEKRIAEVSNYISEKCVKFLGDSADAADEGRLHVGRHSILTVYDIKSEDQAEAVRKATIAALEILGARINPERIYFKHSKKRDTCKIFIKGLRERKQSERKECLIM